MPDNVTAPAAGVSFATDEVAGAHWPYAKLAFGADNSAVPVADANGARLPVLATISGTPTFALDAPSLAALETIELGATTLAALETIQAAVTGTVELGATSLAALESIGIGQPLPAGTNNIGDVDVLTVPTLATTTREYGAGYRASVAASATTFAITGNLTLGATREVRIRASVACWVRFGTTGQDAAVPSANAAANSMPIDANAAEVLRIPAGATHISVIRDSADGAVTFTAVAA